jgi:hypothetical protein
MGCADEVYFLVCVRQTMDIVLVHQVPFVQAYYFESRFSPAKAGLQGASI